MKHTLKIQLIQNLLNDSGIELVSYGLAPNPWGFCFELPEVEDSQDIKDLNVAAMKLDQLLESLNTKEEQILKSIYL